MTIVCVRDLLRHPRGALVTLAALLFSVCPESLSQESRRAAPEYNVKAGYLLLFARYVQWPERSFASDDAPLVIGVLGRDPFGDVLEATLRDQRVGTHPVVWLRMQDLDASAAHLVFIAEGQSRDERRWLEALHDVPVLRVSESADSLDAGAIVRFVTEDGRIRFDVNYTTAERSQLRIASPMLVSARQVRGAPSERRKPGDGGGG